MGFTPDLELTYTDFARLIGTFIGVGGSATGAALTQVDDAIAMGQRWVITPRSIPGVSGRPMPSHDWTFLRPSAQMTLTVGQAEYTLPNNFGNMDGNFQFGPAELYRKIEGSSVARVELKWKDNIGNQAPRCFAIRPRLVGGQGPSLSEVIFGPKPVKAYVLTYRYFAVPRKLSTTNLYAAGGAVLSEVYHWAMRAAAAALHNDHEDGGKSMAEFISLLRAAIDQDRRREPGVFGYNGNFSPMETRTGRHSNSGATSDFVTYAGTLYD